MRAVANRAEGLRLNDGNPLYKGENGKATIKWRHRKAQPGTEDPICVLCCYGPCTGGELQVPGLPLGSTALDGNETAAWLDAHAGAWIITSIDGGWPITTGMRTITGELTKFLDIVPMTDAVIAVYPGTSVQGTVSFNGHIATRHGGYKVTSRFLMDLYRKPDGQVTLDSIGAYSVVRDTLAEMEIVAAIGGRVLLTRTSVVPAVGVTVSVTVPAAEQMSRDGGDVEGKVLQLKRLVDAGALSEAAFEMKKAELLSRL
jgi:hypothetical protein